MLKLRRVFRREKSRMTLLQGREKIGDVFSRFARTRVTDGQNYASIFHASCAVALRLNNGLLYGLRM